MFLALIRFFFSLLFAAILEYKGKEEKNYLRKLTPGDEGFRDFLIYGIANEIVTIFGFYFLISIII